MKISGIICEYNPLHLGHIEHIKYTKSLGDTIVCVMSGNFVQRGAPACLDKYVRARHAIMAGADIVLELPIIYATASAEDFALGAVRLLKAIKCNYLSFGSECGNIELIKKCANELANPTEQLIQGIKTQMDSGKCYPVAVYTALTSIDSHYKFLNRPNNLLAVEYVKNIIKQESAIIPVTMTRKDNYCNTELLGDYVSSKAIRQHIESNPELTEQYVPKYVHDDLRPTINSKYKDFVHTYLNTISKQELSRITGVNEGLENRILSCAKEGNYDLMMTALKTKRYTTVRLQRIMLGALLGTSKRLVEFSKTMRPYTRVLAISKDRMDLLTHLSQCSVSFPPNLSRRQKDVYELDIRANDIFASLNNKSGNKDLTMPLQKI
ncbi:MAG: nucleotidyltransferase family protein [Clostridia bacterium]|nr:nucleotidyltransferase family protein [Clostridia bacterium]